MGYVYVGEVMCINDPLLAYLWKDICKEMKFVTDEQKGDAGKEVYLKSLSSLSVFQSKGPKSSTKRWFSWHHAHEFNIECRSSKLLVMTFLAVRKRWFTNWQDSLLVDLQNTSCRGTRGRQASQLWVGDTRRLLWFSNPNLRGLTAVGAPV